MSLTLTTTQVPIGELKEHPRNARTGNVPKIMESLETHGQYRALVVQRSTMYVCAGNHTLQAIRRLGWETAACHVLDIDDDQATRILLVDNRTSDEADYDREALIAVLEDIQHTGGGLDGTGYDELDLDDLIAELDETKVDPDTPAPTFAPAFLPTTGIRSMILTYEGDEFVWVTDRLADAREDFGVDTNTAAIAALFAAAYPDADPYPTDGGTE